MIDDIFPNLPNNYGRKGNAFKPPTERATKAVRFVKDNALPITGLIIAVVL